MSKAERPARGALAAPQGRTRTSRPSALALAVLGLGYLVIELLAGAPRSPLLPPLPAGVRTPVWTRRGAELVGMDRLGRAGLTWLALVLLVAVTIAFLVLAREAWAGRAGMWPIVAVGVGTLALFVAGPLLLSRDVYSYAAYGRMLAVHGSNPYITPPRAFPGDPFTPVISPAWAGTRSVYGPVFTLLSWAVAGIFRGSPGATATAFKALSAGAVAAAAGLAVFACGRLRPGREAFAAVALVLNPVVVVHTVGGGHNDALVGLGLAGAAAVVGSLDGREGRTAGMGVGQLAVTGLITAAAMVKVVALLPLAMWWWRALRPGHSGVPPGRSGHAGVVAGHLGVFAAVVVASTAPVFAGWRSVTAVVNLASRQGWASGARLVARGVQGVASAVAGHTAATAAAGVVDAAFLALFAWVAWQALGGRGRNTGLRRDGENPPERWAVAMLLFALAAPYLLPWYPVWFLPLLALVGDPGLVGVGVAMTAVLAMTGVPAEPGSAPGLWRAMLLGVHYVAAPLVLALFAVASRQVLRGAGARRNGAAEANRSGS